jgi:uncharacterized protein (TIGR03032 family)
MDNADQIERTEPIEWVVHGELLSILERSQLSLALSARPNHVVLVGAIDGRAEVTTALMAQPMGLAAESGRIAVASPRMITVFANVARLAAHYPARREHFDAFFVPRTIHVTGECHMHDMVFSGRSIVGANTNFSCICRVDGEYSFTPLWKPSFITQLRPEDRCHLNGFASESNELRFVTALSLTDVEGGWREAPDSGGVLIDAQRNIVLRSDLCMPHSPRLIANALYVLNGGEGELLRIDRTTGQHVVVSRLPGFTHGLCEHKGVVFVGLSQNRLSRKKNPPPVAQRFERLLAGVAAVNPLTGQILGLLEFRSGVTEVYDVQALAGVRRAGMQNHLATDSYSAIETPRSVFWNKRAENDLSHASEVAALGNYNLRLQAKEVSK